MKTITRSIFATLLALAILLQSSPAFARRQCKHMNKHCPPTVTLTATATPALVRGATPLTPPVYTCLSLLCATPGK